MVGPSTEFEVDFFGQRWSYPQDPERGDLTSPEGVPMGKDAKLRCVCIDGVWSGHIRWRGRLIIDVPAAATMGELFRRFEGELTEFNGLVTKFVMRMAQGEQFSGGPPCKVDDLHSDAIWAARFLLEEFQSKNG